MSTVWVLMVAVFAGSSDGGVAIIQQEFSSRENCEDARRVIENVRPGGTMRSIVVLGCFEK